MPIYIPPVSSLPDPLPVPGSLSISGLANVGGVDGNYYAPAYLVRNQSGLSFLDVTKLDGLASVRSDQVVVENIVGNVQLDMEMDDFVFFTLAGNVTFVDAGAGVSPARRLCIVLRQDAVGGWTVAWPASVRWSGGVAPVVTAAAGAVSVVELLALQDPVTTNFNLYGSFVLNYTSA